MPKDFGRRIPFDPRIAEEISRSPRMMKEQGGNFLGSWGGPSSYIYWARQPLADRMTYFALVEGYTNPSEIAAVTDLDVKKVEGALSRLEKKGLVGVGNGRL